MNIQNFFIPENESKDTFYTRFEKEEIRSSSLKDLNFVFNKAFNNQIGYYAFIVNKTIYRIFLIPKTISTKNRSDEAILKEFVHYMRELYRLQREYNTIVSIASDSSTIVGSESLSDYSKIQTIEDLAQFKYGVILDSIYEFFQRHKSHSRTLKHFSSQSITGRINLQRNVREPNKSNIHQEKIEDAAYSKLASITYSAIRLFEITKLPITDTNSDQNALRGQIHRVKSLLDKKFNLQDTSSTTLEKLMSQKSRKIFGTKYEHLYFQILSLFGLEVLNDDGEQGQIHHYNIKSDSLFFQMNLLYEFHIYEILSKIFQNIEFTKIKSNIKTYFYKMNAFSWERGYTSESITIKSDPDLIITDDINNIKYIIDTKWKILQGKPELEDVLKLKRDCQVKNTAGYKIIGILIYADMVNEYCEFQEEITGNETHFTFYATRMPFIGTSSFHSSYFKNEAVSPYIYNAESPIQQFSAYKESLQNLTLDEDDSDSSVTTMFESIYDVTTQRIYEAVLKKHSLDEILEYSNEIKEVLHQYGTLLENDNKKFLETAATTRFYFEKYHLSSADLDYTLSASGIWKTIEIELNTSIIYLLRYQSGCCMYGKYNQKEPTSRGNTVFSTGPKNHQKIDITDRRNCQDGYLSNILLGSFKFIFQNIESGKNAFDGGDIYDIYNELFQSDSYAINKLGPTNQLTTFLMKKLEYITQVRNEHVHLAFMDKQKYDEFYNTVFKSEREETGLSLFATLMEFDRSINTFIKISHENSARI